jgi:hypothetical protein
MQILAKPFRRLIATFEVSNASQADDPGMWMLAPPETRLSAARK